MRKQKNMNTQNLFLGVITLFVLNSCTKDNIETSKKDFFERHTSLVAEIKNTYASIVLASYKDALSEAKKLELAIDRFIANPSQKTLNTAKSAWLMAREPYGQTEAYRFANGPIDDEDGPEGLLNAWPLDESYIDVVKHSPESNTNIINNIAKFPTITKEVLKKLNEAGGTNERSISVGYHAIEFLLWGQDSMIPTDGPEGTTGGNRPYTDFLDNGTLSNQDRRRAYLKACAELLVENLQSLVNEWDNSGSNYRTTFLALSNQDAIRNIISGMAILVGPELGTERVFVALNASSQEDEHSCFSDNTHRDLRLNFQGVRNIYRGSYTLVDGSSISGKSIQDLAALLTDSTVDETLNSLFEKANNSVEATGIPFDFAIYNPASRPAIDQASTDLLKVGNQLGLLAASFGINISVKLPD